jgi:hypothetical protein
MDSLIIQHLRNQRDLIKSADREDDYYTIAANAIQHKGSRKDPRSDIQDRGITKIKSKFRLILSRKEGGSGLPPQLAHLDKRHRAINNIVRHIGISKEPLVLLGDPGAGKSVALRQAFLRMVESQITASYPSLVLFIRLGGVDFSMLNDVVGVKQFIMNTLPKELKEHFGALVEQRRVVIFFDGMDEMDRCLYNESVKVLSDFADDYRKSIRTVFSCRLNEFSKEFTHRQVVLLPFDSRQIVQYFKNYLKEEFRIDGKLYRPATLLKRLKKSQFCDYITNPSFLNIFSVYIYSQEKWPVSLSEIYHVFFKTYYQRYLDGNQDRIHLGYDTALEGLAKIAYCISTQVTGGVISQAELTGFLVKDDFRQELFKQVLEEGSKCRILTIEESENGTKIRFEHHRYLEYFTAYYLENDYIEVDWEEKFRDPRWQETFLIMASLNSRFPGIEFLEQSLSEAINDLTILKGDMIEGEEPDEQTYQERIWSEYALLGARVINRIGKKREEIGTCFWCRLIEAIKLLAEVGHPLSQRTVVWACSYLDNFNAYDVLERPFVSKYFFVRSVALHMINEAFRYNKNIGASYHFEICRGVATEHLLRYMYHYVKGLFDKFSFRKLWSITVGIAIPILVSLVLLNGAALVLFNRAANFLKESLSVTSPGALSAVNIGLYAIIAIFSIYIFLYRNLSLNQSICLTFIGLFYCLFLISTDTLTLFDYFLTLCLCVFLFHIISIFLFFVQYLTTTICIGMIWPMVGTKTSLKILYSSISTHSKIGRFINKFSGKYLNWIIWMISIATCIFIEVKTNIIANASLIVLKIFLWFSYFVPLPFNIYIRAAIGFVVFITIIGIVIKSINLYRNFKRMLSNLKVPKNIRYKSIIRFGAGGILIGLFILVLWKLLRREIGDFPMALHLFLFTIIVLIFVSFYTYYKKNKPKIGAKFYLFLKGIFNLSTLRILAFYTFITFVVILLALLFFRPWLISKKIVDAIPSGKVIIQILLLIPAFYFLYRLLLYLNTIIRKVKLPDDEAQWIAAFEKADNSIEAMKLLEHLEKLNKRKFSMLCTTGTLKSGQKCKMR